MIVTPTTTSVEAMTMIKMIFTIRVDKSSFVGDVEFVMGVEFFGDVVFVFVSPRASPRYGQRWRQVSALLALRRLRPWALRRSWRLPVFGACGAVA